MRLNLHKFNGWQRLFVLLAIFWTIGCLLNFNLVIPTFINVNDKQQYGSYVSGNLDKYLSKKSSSHPFDPDLYLNPTKVVMNDGVVLSLYGYSDEEITQAYEKFKSDSENLNPNKGYFIKVFKEIVLLLLVYSLPLISVYLLGWMIGWVVKGFKNPS